MIVQFTPGFEKMYALLSKKIRHRFEERLQLFTDDPYAPLLMNHALHGQYRLYRSINVTGDYRAVYRDMASTHVIFVAIGTHSQLYR